MTINSAKITKQPAHGTASISGISLDYVANSGYVGNDSLQYTITTVDGTSLPATINFTVTAATSVTNPNLILTMDFTDTTHWNIFGGLSVTVDASKFTEPVTSKQLAIYDMTFANARNGVYGEIPLTGGKQYTISWYMMSTAASPPPVCVNFWDEASADLASSNFTPTSSWVRYSATITAPNSGNPNTTLGLICNNTTGSASGLVKLAGLKVEESATVSNYALPKVTALAISTSASTATNDTISIPSGNSGTAVTSVAITTNPTHGTATASGTNIVYKSVAGYTGSDSFAYTLTNVNGTSAPATITVSVSASSPATTGNTFAQGYSVSAPAKGPAPASLPPGGKGGNWTPVLNLTFGTQAKTGTINDPTISDIPTLGNYVVGCNNCGGPPSATQYGQYGSVATIPSSWNQLDLGILGPDGNFYTPRSQGFTTGEQYSLGTNYLRITESATVGGNVAYGQVNTGRFSPATMPNPRSTGIDMLAETQFRCTGQPGQDLPFFWIAFWFTGQGYDLEVDTLESFGFNNSGANGGNSNDNNTFSQGHSDDAGRGSGAMQVETQGGGWRNKDFSKFVTMQMAFYANGNWACYWDGALTCGGTYSSSNPIGCILDNGWFGPSSNARPASGNEPAARFPFYCDYTYLRYWQR